MTYKPPLSNKCCCRWIGPHNLSYPVATHEAHLGCQALSHLSLLQGLQLALWPATESSYGTAQHGSQLMEARHKHHLPAGLI